MFKILQEMAKLNGKDATTELKALRETQKYEIENLLPNNEGKEDSARVRKNYNLSIKFKK